LGNFLTMGFLTFRKFFSLSGVCQYPGRGALGQGFGGQRNGVRVKFPPKVNKGHLHFLGQGSHKVYYPLWPGRNHQSLWVLERDFGIFPLVSGRGRGNTLGGERKGNSRNRGWGQLSWKKSIGYQNLCNHGLEIYHREVSQPFGKRKRRREPNSHWGESHKIREVFGKPPTGGMLFTIQREEREKNVLPTKGVQVGRGVHLRKTRAY